MANADEWAVNFGNRVKAGQDAARQKEQVVAMMRDVIAEKMPQLWNDMMGLFQSHCEAYNSQNNPERRLYGHQSGSHVFLVRPDARAEIVTATYDRQAKNFMIRTPSGPKWYDPVPIMEGAGRIELVERGTGRPMSLAGIVRTSLEDGILHGQ